MVESDPLQLAAWETRLRESSWNLYSLKNMDDFDFRCSDFDPDLLVLGQRFGSGVAFEQAATKATQIPFFVLAFKDAELTPRPGFGKAYCLGQSSGNTRWAFGLSHSTEEPISLSMDRDEIIIYIGLGVVFLVFSVTLYFRSGYFF